MERQCHRFLQFQGTPPPAVGGLVSPRRFMADSGEQDAIVAGEGNSRRDMDVAPPRLIDHPGSNLYKPLYAATKITARMNLAVTPAKGGGPVSLTNWEYYGFQPSRTNDDTHIISRLFMTSHIDHRVHGWFDALAPKCRIPGSYGADYRRDIGQGALPGSLQSDCSSFCPI